MEPQRPHTRRFRGSEINPKREGDGLFRPPAAAPPPAPKPPACPPGGPGVNTPSRPRNCPVFAFNAAPRHLTRTPVETP